MAGVCCDVDDTRTTPRDASPLFSPQPFPPGLIGQRRLESTLFDLRAFEDARRHGGGPDAMVHRPREPSAGSGLIDIKTLIGATARGASAAAVPAVVLPVRGLVDTARPHVSLPRAMPAAAARTRAWLAVACVALFTTAVALAVAVLA